MRIPLARSNGVRAVVYHYYNAILLGNTIAWTIACLDTTLACYWRRFEPRRYRTIYTKRGDGAHVNVHIS